MYNKIMKTEDYKQALKISLVATLVGLITVLLILVWSVYSSYTTKAPAEPQTPYLTTELPTRYYKYGIPAEPIKENIKIVRKVEKQIKAFDKK